MIQMEAKMTSAPLSQNARTLLIAKGLFTVLCFFFGAFGVFFFIWKNNYSASGSCVTLEIISCLSLHLSNSALNGKLEVRYTLRKFKIVFILSLVIGVIELVSCMAWIALGSLHKQTFQLEDHGYYVAAIPSALACLVAFPLAFEARQYMLDFQQVPLPHW